MPRVIVYTAKWCPWCQRVKDWLTKQKISFEEKDVDKDQKAAKEVVEKSGQTGIPIIDIDGKIIIGFDIAALKEALGIKD